jgi:hypothetical protein
VKAGVVGIDYIPKLWNRIEPMLEKVVKHSEGELTTNHYLDYLMDDKMQLWVAIEDNNIVMCMVTQFINYPTKKILRVLSISGERFKELHGRFNGMIEEFALENNCSALELWGRKGWKKMLTDWNDSYIVYTKDLKERMH